MCACTSYLSNFYLYNSIYIYPSVCLSLSLSVMKCNYVFIQFFVYFRIIWVYVSVVSQMIDNPHYYNEVVVKIIPK
jgi:hypothetical protein